jgi:tRNA(Ile)-lysidine synthase TilS/MesJ
VLAVLIDHQSRAGSALLAIHIVYNCEKTDIELKEERSLEWAQTKSG